LDDRPQAQLASKRPVWAWVLAGTAFASALALPLIPGIEQKFWGMEFQLFLGTMLAVPLVLLFGKGRRLRSVIMLASLALFGFLQMACTRAPGNVEMIILGLQNGKPFLMHAIKLGVLVGLAILFARYYCGYICPQGVIQDLLYQPDRKARIPAKVDRVLKLLKYVMLVALIVAPLVWGYRLFREIGPFKVLFNLDGGTALTLFLAVVLVASIFIGRPFCRYVCPIGGLLGLLSKISPLKMRADASVCTHCRKCESACQTGALTVARRETPVFSTTECIVCKECVGACPEGGIYYGGRPGPPPQTEETP